MDHSLSRRQLLKVGTAGTVGAMVAPLGVFAAEGVAGSASRWYKGNTHAHTFWSDGDEFSEMVASWYKEHGYDFLAISDHNRLLIGDAWMPIDQGKRFVPTSVVEKCQKRFGGDWLEIREKKGQREVKLKTLAEVEAKLGELDKFLLIQNEEISTAFEDHYIHLNALNLSEYIAPKVGKSVQETLALNVAAGEEQATRLNRPMLVHVNHPNFARYDVTAEDMAASGANIFEVCNGHPGVRNLGDAAHPSVEKLWDVANTIRIAKMKAAPLLAFGTDDSHNYQQDGANLANPGRAWVMVRAQKLDAAALIEAIGRGDFYASTGVVLRDVVYDPAQRTVTVEVDPEPGVSYAIEFIGTLDGVDPSCKLGETIEGQKPSRPSREYSPEIGKVLARVEGASATYRLTGKELYVRPVVRSSKPVANQSAGGGKLQEAWCQPVGWKK